MPTSISVSPLCRSSSALVVMETYVVGGLAQVTESRNWHGERAVDVVGQLLGRAHWLLQTAKEKRDVSFPDSHLVASMQLRAARVAGDTHGDLRAERRDGAHFCLWKWYLGRGKVVW